MSEFSEFTIGDPLEYDGLEFKKKEWDNIPSIIAKFINHLSQNLQGLSQKCK